MSCNPVEAHRLFGGTNCLHLQDKKTKPDKTPAKNRQKTELRRFSETSLDFTGVKGKVVPVLN
jgi:hypothetical protein